MTEAVKSARVRARLTLDLPEDRVQGILANDVLIGPEHPDYWEVAMRAIEEYAKDHFADLMEFAGEPEVEADA
jgi:hypothetical protein